MQLALLVSSLMSLLIIVCCGDNQLFHLLPSQLVLTS